VLVYAQQGRLGGKALQWHWRCNRGGGVVGVAVLGREQPLSDCSVARMAPALRSRITWGWMSCPGGGMRGFSLWFPLRASLHAASLAELSVRWRLNSVPNQRACLDYGNRKPNVLSLIARFRKVG